MRAFSVHLVVFVHCLVSCCDALEIKDHTYKIGVLKVLVQVGIPYFFYISGIASSFYKIKKGFLSYLSNKFWRLMIPFGLAIPIFLVPRLFFGQEFEDFAYI
jgi:surface polysaccharide O-acyltransferase-like enzyme